MGSNPDNILFLFFFSENFLSSNSIVPGQSSTSCRFCSIILPVPAAGSLGIFFPEPAAGSLASSKKITPAGSFT